MRFLPANHGHYRDRLTASKRQEAFVWKAALFACLGACLLLALIDAARAETAPEPKASGSVAEAPAAGEPSAPEALPARASQAEIIAEIERAARKAGMPSEIAEAVAHTESRFNPDAVGADGEIGLMQVLPSTARMLGYTGNLTAFADPKTNIQYGVAYLAGAWKRSGGDLCTAVMKYRAGHGETRFSYLSVDYCRKVRARMASRGYAVVGSLPVATFGERGGVAGTVGAGGRCRGKCIASSGRGPDLVALNSKLNDIIFRVTVVKVPRP